MQGFNADMLITASLSGGASTSAAVSPSKNPPGDAANNYSSGRFRVTFAGAGQTLTVVARSTSPVRPGSVRFPNAGFFAATLTEASSPGRWCADQLRRTDQRAGGDLHVGRVGGRFVVSTGGRIRGGLANLFVGDIGGGTSFAANGPPGTYFARLRARAGGVLSPPSNEITFTLGSSAPCAPPGPPANLTFNKSGTNLTLTWTPGVLATTYRLLAGTGPGSSNAFDGNLGGATAQTFNVVGIPAGVYGCVRVLSVNACGTSGSSNEVAIPLP